MRLERDEALISDEQLSVCAAHGADSIPCDPNMKVGIALATLEDLPLNALRHRPANGTSGWYIWGGALSEAPEFFLPLHAAHLSEYVPQLVPYLALARRWSAYGNGKIGHEQAFRGYVGYAPRAGLRVPRDGALVAVE
jgi:hypothetical protein